MKYYQLAYLISPNITKEELKELEEKIITFLKQKEGFLDKVEPPLKRSLFYQIKKFKEAFLASCYFFLEPEYLKDLEKNLKSSEKILRYLIISETPPKKLPKPKRVKKPEKVGIKELEKKLEEILGK